MKLNQTARNAIKTCIRVLVHDAIHSQSEVVLFEKISFFFCKKSKRTAERRTIFPVFLSSIFMSKINKCFPFSNYMKHVYLDEKFRFKILTSAFCSILDRVTLFGTTETPLWICHFKHIWAGVLLYFFPISNNLGSFNKLGSSSLAHGLSGDPRGLYAVTKL